MSLTLNQAPENTRMRSYVLIEYETMEQAKYCLRRFVKSKTDKKEKIGDRRAYLTILVNPKNGTKV